MLNIFGKKRAEGGFTVYIDDNAHENETLVSPNDKEHAGDSDKAVTEERVNDSTGGDEVKDSVTGNDSTGGDEASQVEEGKELFEVIEEEEIRNTRDIQLDKYNQRMEEALNRLEEVGDLTGKDLEEIRSEIRHLEEKLFLWQEVRRSTILRLREIADYIDSLGRKTGVAKVVGSSGGIVAGSLTVAGGVMTVLTAGAAAPVLIAGAAIGLASGLTGGAAAITRKIISSKQMQEVQIALEVDAAATSELKIEVDRVKEDSRLLKVTSVAMTVGGLASSTKGFVDLIRGSNPGDTISLGLEVVGKIFGEDVNKEITKLLLQSGGRVLSGAVTSVFGGVTLLWDVYQLSGGIKELAAGGLEGAKEIRSIAEQLEEALEGLTGEDGEEGEEEKKEERSEGDDESSEKQDNDDEKEREKQSSEGEEGFENKSKKEEKEKILQH